MFLINFQKIARLFSEIFYEENSAPFLMHVQDFSEIYKQQWINFPFERIFVALEYEKNFKDSILAFKYKRERDMEYMFHTALWEIALMIKNENITISYITFPPIHWFRKILRGYNQSEILAHYIWKKLGVPVIDIFQKTHWSRKQSTLKKEDRIKNLSGSIKIRGFFQRKNKLKNTTILFIDDVISTGSTAKECGDILKKLGVEKVIGTFLSRGDFKIN